MEGLQDSLLGAQGYQRPLWSPGDFKEEASRRGNSVQREVGAPEASDGQCQSRNQVGPRIPQLTALCASMKLTEKGEDPLALVRVLQWDTSSRTSEKDRGGECWHQFSMGPQAESGGARAAPKHPESHCVLVGEPTGALLPSLRRPPGSEASNRPRGVVRNPCRTPTSPFMGLLLGLSFLHWSKSPRETGVIPAREHVFLLTSLGRIHSSSLPSTPTWAADPLS